jgi:hypothetical protein
MERSSSSSNFFSQGRPAADANRSKREKATARLMKDLAEMRMKREMASRRSSLEEERSDGDSEKDDEVARPWPMLLRSKTHGYRK